MRLRLRRPRYIAALVAMLLVASTTLVSAVVSPPYGAVGNQPLFELDGNALTENGTSDGVLDWDDDDPTAAGKDNLLPGDGVIEAVRNPAGSADGIEDGSCVQTFPAGITEATAGTSDGATSGSGKINAGLLICDGSVGNFADHDTFTQGSKNEGTNWNITGGSSPKKGDFSEVMVYAKFGDSLFDDDDGDCGVTIDNSTTDGDPVEPAFTAACRTDTGEDFTDVFVYGASTKLDANGSTHLDIELNQQNIKRNCTDSDPGLDLEISNCVVARTDGDILIAVDFVSGGTPIVRLFKFVTTFPAGVTKCENDPQVSLPCFINITGTQTPAEALTAITNSDLDSVEKESAFEIDTPGWKAVGCEPVSTDGSQGCKIRDKLFEAAWTETFTDLSFFGIEATCPGFSNVVFKSRTSNELNSSLADDAEGKININLCGKLKILKDDDQGNSLAGATFQVRPDPRLGGSATCTGVTGTCLEVTDGGTNDDDGVANGEILIDSAAPGTYNVCESAAPSGYATDASFTCPTTTSVTVTANGTATVGPFVNRLGTLEWEKRDDLGALQSGAQFTISPNPFSCYSGTAPGTISDDADGTDGPGTDKDGTGGQLKLERVCLGSYTVTESASPTGFALDTDVTRAETVSSADLNAAIGTQGTNDTGVTDESDFHNRLGTLEWEKRDDLGALQGGATFTISPNPFSCYSGTAPGTISDDTDGTGGPGTDKDGDAGQLRLERVCVGTTYTITESGSPTGFALDPDATRDQTVPSSGTDLSAVVGTQGSAQECPDTTATDTDEVDFCNRLGVIKIDKKDKLTNALVTVAGATFTIAGPTVTSGPFSCHDTNADGTDELTITVVDNGANDADPAVAKIQVNRVCLNATGYTVTETVAPSGFGLPSPAFQGPTALTSSTTDLTVTFTFADLPLLRLFTCVERMDSTATGCQPIADAVLKLVSLDAGCTFSGTAEQIQTAAASGVWTDLELNCLPDGGDTGTLPDGPGYKVEVGTPDP